MRRKLGIALVTAVIGTGAAFMAGWIADAVATPADPAPARQPAAGPMGLLQPDTSSPSWKPLSDDLGIMLRKDERSGLRGRLFARVDGVWRPVPVDGLADTLGAVPVK